MWFLAEGWTHAAGPKIGFVGLGAMGFGMAASLCRAGFAVTGHDLREEALARLVERGGARAATPEDAARARSCCSSWC